MRAQLSVMALYDFDNTLFDAFHLPEALEDQRDVIESNVLVETAELETLFSNPIIFKKILDSWSYKQVPIWDKLYKTTQLVYNPIWNVDGSVTETIEIERAGENSNKEVREGSSSSESHTTNNRTGSSTNTETRQLSNSDSENRNLHSTLNETRDLESSENTTSNKDNTGQVSRAVFAYNSGDESPESVDHTNGHETNVLESSGTDEGTINRTGSDTGTVTHNVTDTGTVSNIGSSTDNGTSETTGTGSETGTTTNNGTESSTERHTNKQVRQGNVGVTTTQSMIREEREVDLFNIVDIIVNDFKNRFCLLVY